MTQTARITSCIFKKAHISLSLFPTPPGMPSRVIQVGETTSASISFGQRCVRNRAHRRCA